MADSIHCQLLSGKYGCAVTTAGGSGDAEVLHYVNYFLNELGVVTVGEVGAVLGRNPAALDPAIDEASMLGTTLVDSIQTKRTYPEQRRISQREERFSCS